MKVLVACECSGRVRDAFKASGHDAWSCDLKPPETEGQHIQDDVLKHLDEGWDLMIAHPDCTRLANSGVRWLHERPDLMAQVAQAAAFFNALLNADIPKIGIENPIQHGYARDLIRKYNQIIQPWQFGDAESKATCLWLKNLPPLMPTHPKPDVIRQSTWMAAPSEHRKADRARTFQGIANAMAQQWGG